MHILDLTLLPRYLETFPWPPIPSHWTAGSSTRRARIRLAPCRSPEDSPAEPLYLDIHPEAEIDDAIGERILIGDSGACIILVAANGLSDARWAVYSPAGKLHSYEYHRDEAEEIASTLGGGGAEVL